MGISNFTLKRIFDSIYPRLINSKIERIINISDNDFLLSLFKDGKSSNLLLSLDASLPIMVESKSYKVDAINTSNYQCNMLKKYLDHAVITKAEKVENDRIIIFETKKWSQSYQLIEVKMIFELFPLSPNIIFVDKNNIILDAFKRSESLDSKHPIYRNLQYTFPQASEKYFDENTPLFDMKNKVNKSEYRYLESLNDDEYKHAIKSMLNEKAYYVYKNDVSSLRINQEAQTINLDQLFDTLLEKKTFENKTNKYEHIFKMVEQKIKSAKKRILNIEKDKEKFLNANQYQEKGTLLYLGSDTYKRGDKKINIEGVDIELDPKLDLASNAQKYFKLYKKAKSGLIQVEIQKQNALKELDYFERIATEIKFASNDDMQEIILDLAEHHFIKDPRPTNKAKKQPGNKRYNPHFIKTKEGYKIGYGLSSYQNEELTFNLAHKDDIYLHIKDFHGPHVIIFNPNPSEDELLLGGEIALYFTSKEAGEVYYTKKANVKKVPGNRGLVTMSTQNLMVINNIRESTLKLLKRC